MQCFLIKSPSAKFSQYHLPSLSGIGAFQTHQHSARTYYKDDSYLHLLFVPGLIRLGHGNPNLEVSPHFKTGPPQDIQGSLFQQATRKSIGLSTSILCRFLERLNVASSIDGSSFYFLATIVYTFICHPKFHLSPTD